MESDWISFWFLELRAESECRVEVNPEDVHQESASETNCSSVRTRRGTGSVSFSQRKNRKLQWVITRVDNGNLHRPRPAYYGPLEEDSSDMDPSDLENTSPRCQGYPGMPPTSPGVQTRMNSEPISPRAMGHNGPWAPAMPQEREEDIARKKCMLELQSQMGEMKRQLEMMQAKYRLLEAQESQELQTRGAQANVGPQVACQFNSPGESREAKSVSPLNPRNLEGYPVNSNEALIRYQDSTDDPNSYLFKSRLDRLKAGQADGRASGQETGADTVSMLSPPETVASPPGENPPGAGGPSPNGQEVRNPSIPAAMPIQGPRARLQPFPPPIQPARAPPNAPGARKVAGGPAEKIYRCGHPGCKSTFARNCELKYVSRAKLYDGPQQV